MATTYKSINKQVFTHKAVHNIHNSLRIVHIMTMSKLPTTLVSDIKFNEARLKELNKEIKIKRIQLQEEAKNSLACGRNNVV